jgi:Peptidase family M28
MRRAALVLAVLLGVAAPAVAQQPPAITGQDLAPHLNALQDIANANGGRRVAGEPGAEATVSYIEQQLTALGWQVQRQPVQFPYYEQRSAPALHDLQPGRDFVTMRYSPSVDATGRLRVFLGESCIRRYLRSVRPGEIVFLPFTTCLFSRAARNVKAEGGVAMLSVGSSGSFPLPATTLDGKLDVPVFLVANRVGARLSRTRRNRTVRVRVDGATTIRTADNVIAERPGAPARVVMAGGHLDSVLEGPGINDNASGIASLLEIAERVGPGVRLGFWTAEEWGLYGSRQYVASLPPDQRSRIAGYINLDMVGSPNAVPEIYDARNAVTRALRKRLPRAGSTPATRADSDHDAFRRAGIAISGIYTGGPETKSRAQQRRHGGRAGAPRDRCYHRACDAVANVDAATAARMATVTAGALLELAG